MKKGISKKRHPVKPKATPEIQVALESRMGRTFRHRADGSTALVLKFTPNEQGGTYEIKPSNQECRIILSAKDFPTLWDPI